MLEKSCQDCGEVIKGRSDKKFCSDQCRNSFNNKLNSDETNFIRNVNNILRKNRRILSELNHKQKTTLHKDRMLERGFSFQYYTNTYTTQKGSTYYFCYEQGYLPLENNLYMLVVWKSKE